MPRGKSAKSTAAEKSGDDAPKMGRPPQSTFANQADLAEILGCSREAIRKALSRPGNPGKRPDGRYPVEEWREFLGRPAADSDEGKTKIELEAEKLRLHNAHRRTLNKKLDGELESVETVAQILNEMAASFATKLNQCKNTLAARVVGVTPGEAAKRIGNEHREVLKQLALGEWAQKKSPFWRKVSARLSDLQKSANLGDGLSDT